MRNSMDQSGERLEQQAAAEKIRIHEPFAKFLRANESMHTFELSLLDCYRFAGHACHATTSAFLMTEAAVRELFPETHVCERGDLSVEFGSQLEERATGPRSNIISFITGAWGESGFPGFKGNRFARNNLVSYGHTEIPKMAVKFNRTSTKRSVVIEFDAKKILDTATHQLDFPMSWRAEISAILNSPEKALTMTTSETR